ncbi:hypothetical protein ACSVDA_06480 [Cytobacillus sp. Hm23]
MPLGDPKGELTAYVYMGTTVHHDALLMNILHKRSDFRTKIYRAMIEQPKNTALWEQCREIGGNSILLAHFDGNLEAGEVVFNGLHIGEWHVMRDGKKIYQIANDEDIPAYDYTDYTVVAQREYEYAVKPIAVNGVEGDAIGKRITPTHNGYWLVDEDNPTHILFQFLYNTFPTPIPLEEDRAGIRTFAEKPFIRYGQYYAERGTITDLLSEREDYERLRRLALKRKPLLLKSWRDDSWRVNIFNIQRTPNIEGETLSVDWVEVGDKP